VALLLLFSYSVLCRVFIVYHVRSVFFKFSLCVSRQSYERPRHTVFDLSFHLCVRADVRTCIRAGVLGGGIPRPVGRRLLVSFRCLSRAAIFDEIKTLITARCYASAVLAMGLCPSVSVSVSVCHKSVFY